MRFLSIKSSAMLLVLTSIDDSGGSVAVVTSSGGRTGGGGQGATAAEEGMRISSSSPGGRGGETRSPHSVGGILERIRGQSIKLGQVDQVINNYNILLRLTRGFGSGLLGVRDEYMLDLYTILCELSSEGKDGDHVCERIDKDKMRKAQSELIELIKEAHPEDVRKERQGDAANKIGRNWRAARHNKRMDTLGKVVGQVVEHPTQHVSMEEKMADFKRRIEEVLMNEPSSDRSREFDSLIDEMNGYVVDGKLVGAQQAERERLSTAMRKMSLKVFNIDNLPKQGEIDEARTECEDNDADEGAVAAAKTRCQARIAAATAGIVPPRVASPHTGGGSLDQFRDEWNRVKAGTQRERYMTEIEELIRRLRSAAVGGEIDESAKSELIREIGEYRDLALGFVGQGRYQIRYGELSQNPETTIDEIEAFKSELEGLRGEVFGVAETSRKGIIASLNRIESGLVQVAALGNFPPSEDFPELEGRIARIKEIYDHYAAVDKLKAGVYRKLLGGLLIKGAIKGNIEKVRKSLKLGADVDPTNNQNTPGLLLASMNGHVDVVEALLREGAGVHVREPQRQHTALLYAAWYNRLPVVQALLRSGADIADQNKDGETALILAPANAPVNIRPTLEAALREQPSLSETQRAARSAALAQLLELRKRMFSEENLDGLLDEVDRFEIPSGDEIVRKDKDQLLIAIRSVRDRALANLDRIGQQIEAMKNIDEIGTIISHMNLIPYVGKYHSTRERKEQLLGAIERKQTELMISRSAVAIQSRYRTHQAQHKFRQVKSAVTNIQRVVRGHLGRQRAKALDRENKAAAEIDSYLDIVRPLMDKSHPLIAAFDSLKLNSETRIGEIEDLKTRLEGLAQQVEGSPRALVQDYVRSCRDVKESLAALDAIESDLDQTEDINDVNRRLSEIGHLNDDFVAVADRKAQILDRLEAKRSQLNTVQSLRGEYEMALADEETLGEENTLKKLRNLRLDVLKLDDTEKGKQDLLKDIIRKTYYLSHITREQESVIARYETALIDLAKRRAEGTELNWDNFNDIMDEFKGYVEENPNVQGEFDRVIGHADYEFLTHLSDRAREVSRGAPEWTTNNVDTLTDLERLLERFPTDEIGLKNRSLGEIREIIGNMYSSEMRKIDDLFVSGVTPGPLASVEILRSYRKLWHLVQRQTVGNEEYNKQISAVRENILSHRHRLDSSTENSRTQLAGEIQEYLDLIGSFMRTDGDLYMQYLEVRDGKLSADDPIGQLKRKFEELSGTVFGSAKEEVTDFIDSLTRMEDALSLLEEMRSVSDEVSDEQIRNRIARIDELGDESTAVVERKAQVRGILEEKLTEMAGIEGSDDEEENLSSSHDSPVDGAVTVDERLTRFRGALVSAKQNGIQRVRDLGAQIERSEDFEGKKGLLDEIRDYEQLEARLRGLTQHYHDSKNSPSFDFSGLKAEFSKNRDKVFGRPREIVDRILAEIESREQGSTPK